MSAFEPEIVDAMGRAFDMAVTKLSVRDENSRRLIAGRIITAARTGEIDSARLCEIAVRSATLAA